MSGGSNGRYAARLYPRSVRRRLGTDLDALLETRRGAARAGGLTGWIGFGLWLVADLAVAWIGEPFRRSPGAGRVNRPPRGLWLADLAGDVRVAWRGLVRRPVFLVAVLATLGLTIGAATTIYSVVDWVLLRPLPYPESDRLVELGMKFSDTDPYRLAGVSVPNVKDWRAGLRTIDPVSGATWTQHVLLGDGVPVAMRGAAVTDRFFETLGVQPAQGRGFNEADHAVGAEAVAILSWGAWQDRFGGDPGIIGRSLRMREGVMTVVGVMPRGFRGPETVGLGSIDVWTPFALDDPAWSNRTHRPLLVLGRLVEGADITAARDDLTRVTTALAEAYPEANRTREGEPWLGGLVTLESTAMAAVGKPLLLLSGSAALLLLIGCVNVANLVLARGTERQREMSVRLAMGAGRLGVTRHVLVESLLLSAVGGIIGVGLAWLGLAAFRGLAPSLPRLAEITIDGRVLMATFALSTFTGLAFGLVPALRLSGIQPARGLNAVARGSTGGRAAGNARAGLTVVETSLALVLLVAAGLLSTSLVRLQSVDAGFEPDGVLRARIGSSTVSEAERPAYYARIVDQVVGRAGIESAAFALNAPLETPDWRAGIAVEDPAAAWQGGVDTGTLTSGYFEVLGVPVIEGRDFDERDGAGAPPVVIVNRSFAARAWPGGDAVGRRLRLSADPASTDPWRTVIAVVGDIRQNALTTEPEPMVYVPMAQEAWSPSMNLLFRAGPDRAAAATAVRAALAELDPSSPPPTVTTMEDRVSVLTRPARLLAVLVGVFGVLGTTLAAVGLYGTMAYAVRVRRREFGIRMALGASTGAIALAELRRGAVILGVGVVMGLLGAALVSRALEGLLFGVRPLDPITIALMTAVLLVVGAAAAAGPARSAASTPPSETLRAD